MKPPPSKSFPPRLTISFPLWLIYGTRGEYERIPRQQRIVGDGGRCDLPARLVGILLMLAGMVFFKEKLSPIRAVSIALCFAATFLFL